MAKFMIHFLALSFLFTRAYGFIPLFAGSAAVAATGWLAYKLGLPCHFVECCSDPWIQPNFTQLQEDLHNRVFGQHLAIDIVLRLLKSHLTDSFPQKALVLSFNGGTGCGKTFVSEIIAKSVFKKGAGSHYIHRLRATDQFHDINQLGRYKQELQSWVKENVKKCARSLFIIDEIDKMPEGLVDSLHSFLEHYIEVEGVDYKKAMFLFLSNTGASIINNEALKHWGAGKKREDITIKQMDRRAIQMAAYNREGGFKHSSLIKSSLIDYFVPFLPLERKHVKKCVENLLKARNHTVSHELVATIVDNEIEYFPEGKEVFSVHGCKTLATTVGMYITADSSK